MSENKDAMYPRDSHPHTGDPRVDPRARRNRTVVNKPQETLDSLIQMPKSIENNPKRKLQKPTFYTVRAGIDYTTSPRGSEQGSPLAGRIRIVYEN